MLKSNKKCGCKTKKCKHYNLLVLYPSLCEEWDYDSNELNPEECMPGSRMSITWRCKLNPCGCHVWNSPIYNRVGNSSGCPYCYGRACEHTNLLANYPKLMEEWDYDKNTEDPILLTKSSRKKVWWVCKHNDCGCHKWQSTIYNRTLGNRNCPFCVNKKLCLHSNLLATHPLLCEEWDYARNSTTPDKYSSGSGKLIHWKCKTNLCGCHEWTAAIHSRTTGTIKKINPNGCPFCVNQTLCSHNNLEYLYPDLCKEWDLEKNNVLPSDVSAGSDLKVWWKCNKNHSWKTAIYCRATRKNPSNCPVCCKKSYSKNQIKWLQETADRYDISIQTVESPDGEHKVQKSPGIFYKLDGFTKFGEHKVAFEFDGCFWHGCWKCFNPDDINKITKTTFRELNNKTEEKRQFLIQNDYFVITMKECEYGGILDVWYNFDKL